MSDSELPPDRDDPGEPIAELAGLREAPGPGFVMRIREGIQTRMFASQFLDFALTMSLRFLEEVGNIVFGIFDRPGREPRREGDAES